jgi:hypothetical protein
VVQDTSKNIINAYGANAKAAQTWGNVVSQTASMLSSLAFGWSSITSIIDTWNDTDLSFWEKF